MAMTEQARKALRAFRRISERGFAGMELALMDSMSDGRIRVSCYQSDGRDNYSQGEYLFDVVIDATREDPFLLEEARNRDVFEDIDKALSDDTQMAGERRAEILNTVAAAAHQHPGMYPVYQ